jgi:spermidine synthase
VGKITDFLAGIKILEEVISPQNGKITVVRSLVFGKYLQVGGLTQSGGIIKTIWTTSLKAVRRKNRGIKSCLILGLGGGSIVEVLRKLWPDVRITAVDIDPVMVELGKKHLELTEKLAKIEIADAYEFTQKTAKNSKKFDLVCVDLYIGDEFPAKFESGEFLRVVKKILTKGGIVVFNRLYYGNKRPRSVKFWVLLEKFFANVEVVYPEANVMFICASGN